MQKKNYFIIRASFSSNQDGLQEKYCVNLLYGLKKIKVLFCDGAQTPIE